VYKLIHVLVELIKKILLIPETMQGISTNAKSKEERSTKEKEKYLT